MSTIMKHSLLKYLSAILVVMSSSAVFAQQDPQFTNYMYNTTVINPAYAGTRDALSILALYRTQWAGLDGAPVTASASVHSPMTNSNLGWGLSVVNDEIGPSIEQHFSADFSYRITFANLSKLSFGLKASANLLNTALEDVIFQFIKVDESELVLADEFKNILRKTRESLQNNFDQIDPQFVSLREELERIFKKKNLSEVTQADMIENMHLLQKIYDQAKELNRKNALLKAKYINDEKYTRIHKRLSEKGTLNAKEMQLHNALMQVKQHVDNKLEGQEDIIKNEAFFKRYLLQLVVQEFKKNENIPLDFPTTETINNLIVNEYLQQYQYR